MLHRNLLLAMVLSSILLNQLAFAVTFELVQPSPRHTLYNTKRAPLALMDSGAITVRHSAGLEREASRFRAVAMRLIPNLDIRLRQDGALAAQSLLISTSGAWTGPETWPEAPEKAEGYALHIDAEGISVVGQDVQGSGHALQTVLQLMLQAAEQRSAIPAGRIVDWPAVRERSILLSLRKLKGTDDISYLKSVLAACGALKYNSVFLEFNAAAPGEKHPFPKTVPAPLTDAQLQGIRDAAKEHGLRVNLYFQFGGHCKWLLDEPGYAALGSVVQEPLSWDNSNWCPLQPGLPEVVQDLVERQARILEPEWIHIGHDEMGHGEFGTTPAAQQSGLSREQLIGRSLEMVRNAIKASGSDAKLLLWHDLLAPDRYKSPSRVGFVEGPELLKLVPSGIGIAIWKYEGNEELSPLIRYFSTGERPRWLSTFQAEYAFRVASYASLYRADGVLSTHWYESPWCTWNDPRGISAAAMNSVVASAAAAWNPEFDAARSMTLDRVGLFRRLVEGLPRASRTAVVPPRVMLSDPQADGGPRIEDPVLQSLSAALPRHVISPEGLTFELFSQPVTPSKTGAEPTRVAVRSAVTAVHFLHATGRPGASSGLNSWQRGSETPEIGEYRLKFQDGTEAVVPLKYRWNIQNWNADEGAYDCRIAWNGTYRETVQAQLTFTTWRAPDGVSRQLQSIELIGREGGSPQPHLWAATVETPVIGAEKTRDDGFGSVVFQESFEYPSSGDFQKVWEARRAVQVPAEAGEPSHVLITLPQTPADAKPSRLDLQRKNLQMDVASANAISLNVRSTVASDDSLTAIIYLGNSKGDNGSYYLAYPLPSLSSEWKRITLPLDAARTEGKRPGTAASTFDILRISFWHRNIRPVEIRISDIAIGQYIGPEIFNTVPAIPTRAWLPEPAH